MKNKDCLVQTISKTPWKTIDSFPIIDGSAGRNLPQHAQAAGPQQVGDLVLWMTCCSENIVLLNE